MRTRTAGSPPRESIFAIRRRGRTSASAAGSTGGVAGDSEVELDNYRAVLEWTLKDGHDMALGGALAGALERLWRDGGLTAEGRYWIDLAQVGLDESVHPQVAARLWRASATLSMGKSKHDYAQRALALYESVGDKMGRLGRFTLSGVGLFQMGHLEEASEANTRALAAMRTLGNKPGVADCLSQQALIQWDRGDVVAARELYAQALAAHSRPWEMRPEQLWCWQILRSWSSRDGQVEQALRLTGEALEILARGKNATNLAIGYLNIAAYRIALGDVRWSA